MPEITKDLSFRRILDSLKLTPKHRLVEFGDIWAEIFLWCFMTSIVVHLIATIVAIISLRSHKIGRWYSIIIILAGIITPIVPSALTSALLSAIFYAASVEIKPFFCFILGVGQTGVILFFSFLKILSTL
ncbi:unnamed protein product [Rotaria magnacalcarata]|uniref:Transmembrane protein 170A n=1 Tax=Rotaria magnacalcarata TaxID=392030 RepID=A0A816RY14_9BILA|nr:unnamed protein product [Rotaria magnacalcarata]CAF1625289.1 unnamed protein product [Rotaria magnacalcarata]CAF2078441.1 unnamed protein product [Rotaria magnacalcarata]CAF2088768.1 unnamed protein product [Rotaria magnacalcarata]CAF2109344.1 unnamed protein product [Rotaria magnacalcarata]